MFACWIKHRHNIARCDDSDDDDDDDDGDDMMMMMTMMMMIMMMMVGTSIIGDFEHCIVVQIFKPSNSINSYGTYNIIA